jgi:hypothetical protein
VVLRQHLHQTGQSRHDRFLRQVADFRAGVVAATSLFAKIGKTAGIRIGFAEVGAGRRDG